MLDRQPWKASVCRQGGRADALGVEGRCECQMQSSSEGGEGTRGVGLGVYYGPVFLAKVEENKVA